MPPLKHSFSRAVSDFSPIGSQIQPGILPTLMKKKILIIEDQAPMRRNIALMLQLEGYTVLTAENGRIGLEMARKESC
jgi:PleD family two-component response regulator